ncbi:MAG: type II toxin-antitoxin system RelE/ParE family toxin [Bacteroidota bacterium]
MAVVRWTPQAIQDINDIAEFIAKDSVRYASLFVLKVFEKELVLSFSIRLGRMVPEFDNENIRELIFQNYRIIYKVVNDDRNRYSFGISRITNIK